MARGVTVSPLESGEWAWTAWVATQPVSYRLTGIEASEIAAQEAGRRALDRLAAEATAAASSRRAVPIPQKLATLPNPHA